MRAVALRSGFGVLLLGVAVALLAAWRADHMFFAAITGALFVILTMATVARHAWRQTTPDSFISRGIPLDAGESFNMDPGLRRDLSFVSLPGFNRGQPGMRPARPAVQKAVKTDHKVAKAESARSGKRRKEETLSPEATVNLAGDREAAGVDDVLANLDSALIGLRPVKKKVEEIGSLLLVDQARQRFGLTGPRPNLHMCFTGSPGTGKTTVALMMAELLHRLGYLEKGHLVHAMRDDLVGQYIGHTAPKTKAVLQRAMGGVLFIDEAYSLYRAEDSKDYGHECTEILMQVMENERDKLVVIFAGYKRPMDRFFESNPGMSSRIAHHLDFAEYHVDELIEIGRLMLDQSSYYMSADAEEAFRKYLRVRMSQPRFANARSVRNELEAARLRHAHRLAADARLRVGKDDLMRLEAADVVPPDSADSARQHPPATPNRWTQDH